MSNWDWQMLCRNTADQTVMDHCLGTHGDITYLQWLGSAWGWTLSVSVLALLVALIVGLFFGVLRTLPDKRLAFIGEAWTELFRNIPLLVQVFLWYNVLPRLFPVLQTSVPSFMLVVFALGFFTSARVAEQVKTGIRTLPRGQMQAALAMGMSLPQAYRYVILPMALRIVIPPLTSESMNIVKNSAVAFAVSIPELAQYAQQVSEETSHFEETFIPVTALYFISAFALNRLFKFIEQRVRVPGLLGAK